MGAARTSTSARVRAIQASTESCNAVCADSKAASNWAEPLGVIVLSTRATLPPWARVCLAPEASPSRAARAWNKRYVSPVRKRGSGVAPVNTKDVPAQWLRPIPTQPNRASVQHSRYSIQVPPSTKFGPCGPRNLSTGSTPGIVVGRTSGPTRGPSPKINGAAPGKPNGYAQQTAVQQVGESYFPAPQRR